MKYFVAFETQGITGNAAIKLHKEIKKMEDIDIIEKWLTEQDKNIIKPVVINYIPIN